jgi:hypothetical protein
MDVRSWRVMKLPWVVGPDTKQPKTPSSTQGGGATCVRPAPVRRREIGLLAIGELDIACQTTIADPATMTARIAVNALVRTRHLVEIPVPTARLNSGIGGFLPSLIRSHPNADDTRHVPWLRLYRRHRKMSARPGVGGASRLTTEQERIWIISVSCIPCFLRVHGSVTDPAAALGA